MIYFTPYLQLGLGALGIYLGGLYVWMGFLILFLVLPFIEIWLKDFKFSKSLYHSTLAPFSLLMTPVALSFLIGLSLWRASHINSFFESLGLILSVGVLMGAYAVTSAHELVHRRDVKLRALGVYNLMLVNFAHWGVEHVFGHHKHVATPCDPATARINETVYQHWIRNYWGGLVGAWKISRFKFLIYWCTTLIASVAVASIFGVRVMLIWWAISIVAILLLQTVDYIEHYGLVRSKNSEGFYMAFRSSHSWDTLSTWTNISLFNLGLHSHHHIKATLPFPDLNGQVNARLMPFGYSVMVPLALIPWIYIPLMNKKLAEIE